MKLSEKHKQNGNFQNMKFENLQLVSQKQLLKLEHKRGST